jgi:hypothetical protein
MDVKLDHILLGAPDLDAASDAFASLTGVVPATGGSHPGFGTRNRLAAIGPDAFWEIIAPDPAQDIAGKPRAEMIAAWPAPALLTFAIQTTDFDGLIDRALGAGLEAGEPLPMSRTRPDGVKLAWRVVHFRHPAYGLLIPFAIDWMGSPHPATTSPAGCVLRSLAVLHPHAAGLAAMYRALGLAVDVQGGLKAGMVAVLDTPKGAVGFVGS